MSLGDQAKFFRELRLVLVEFLAAQIDSLDGPHVDDIFERILLQHKQVGGLALG
jgi:hypothetical protein